MHSFTPNATHAKQRGRFEDNQGRLGSFAFTDPWDGMQYPNCSLASDALPLGSMAEMQGQTSLTVIENRNL
jgi:hypothetical protein